MLRKILIAMAALAAVGSMPAIAGSTPARVTIFSNLGTGDTAYDCCTGYTVVGPQGGPGELWVAAAFTPDSDRIVTEIDVAVSYHDAGKNKVVLSLYADDNGLPGAVLGSWALTDLPEFQTCCTVAVKQGKKRLSVSVKGGTQYWVVLSNPSTNKDLQAVWNWNTTDTSAADPAVESWCSSDDGGFCFFDKTWVALSGTMPAFAVYGK